MTTRSKQKGSFSRKEAALTLSPSTTFKRNWEGRKSISSEPPTPLFPADILDNKSK
jgi:hypothetical protein